MEHTGQQKKKLSGLDYTPLHQPVSDADIKAFRSARQPKHSWTKPLVIVGSIVIGIVILVAIFLGFILIKNNDFWTSFMPAMFWVFLVGLVIYFAKRALVARYKRLVRLDRFAVKNGLEFRYDAPMGLGNNGMIFDEGHSRKLNEGFFFPDMTELGNYEYVVGNGKNQNTHYWAYLKVRLPRKLPHMVLDAKKNNIFGKISNLTDTFDRGQVLSLEGDFNEHFTLYAPKQYERDALYVFTPDVMAKVIDSGSAYDMEVVDDELYLYRSGKINLASETELRSLLSIVEQIGTDLHDQVEYYADERVGDRAQNIVALEGARLKTGINWVVVVAVIIMTLFYTLDIWGPLVFPR
jgi:hypothetical protein